MIVVIITLLLTARSSTPPNLGANNWTVWSARPQDRTTDGLTLINCWSSRLSEKCWSSERLHSNFITNQTHSNFQFVEFNFEQKREKRTEMGPLQPHIYSSPIICRLDYFASWFHNRTKDQLNKRIIVKPSTKWNVDLSPENNETFVILVRRSIICSITYWRHKTKQFVKRCNLMNEFFSDQFWF